VRRLFAVALLNLGLCGCGTASHEPDASGRTDATSVPDSAVSDARDEGGRDGAEVEGWSPEFLARLMSGAGSRERGWAAESLRHLPARLKRSFSSARARARAEVGRDAVAAGWEAPAGTRIAVSGVLLRVPRKDADAVMRNAWIDREPRDAHEPRWIDDTQAEVLFRLADQRPTGWDAIDVRVVELEPGKPLRREGAFPEGTAPRPSPVAIPIDTVLEVRDVLPSENGKFVWWSLVLTHSPNAGPEGPRRLACIEFSGWWPDRAMALLRSRPVGGDTEPERDVLALIHAEILPPGEAAAAAR
jgi:hypothetical protein